MTLLVMPQTENVLTLAVGDLINLEEHLLKSSHNNELCDLTNITLQKSFKNMMKSFLDQKKIRLAQFHEVQSISSVVSPEHTSGILSFIYIFPTSFSSSLFMQEWQGSLSCNGKMECIKKTLCIQVLLGKKFWRGKKRLT